MKKLILIALILFALYNIGTKETPPMSEDSGGEEKRPEISVSYFAGEVYDGILVCISKCEEIASEILG